MSMRRKENNNNNKMYKCYKNRDTVNIMGFLLLLFWFQEKAAAGRERESEKKNREVHRLMKNKTKSNPCNKLH